MHSSRTRHKLQNPAGTSRRQCVLRCPGSTARRLSHPPPVPRGWRRWYTACVSRTMTPKHRLFGANRRGVRHRVRQHTAPNRDASLRAAVASHFEVNRVNRVARPVLVCCFRRGAHGCSRRVRPLRHRPTNVGGWPRMRRARARRRRDVLRRARRDDRGATLVRSNLAACLAAALFLAASAYLLTRARRNGSARGMENQSAVERGAHDGDHPVVDGSDHHHRRKRSASSCSIQWRNRCSAAPRWTRSAPRSPASFPSAFARRTQRHVRQFGVTGVSDRQMGRRRVLSGLRANGEEFPFEASISQIRDGNGKLYTVMLRDITERVKAERRCSARARNCANCPRICRISARKKNTRIARELHDDLGQQLTALKMDISSVEQALDETTADRALRAVARHARLIDATVASVRRIAADLRAGHARRPGAGSRDRMARRTTSRTATASTWSASIETRRHPFQPAPARPRCSASCRKR